MFQHGGNLRQLEHISGIPAEEILDFSANINPLGLPDWVRPLVSSVLDSVVHYPDPECRKLIAAAEKRYGCVTDELVVANGSSEIIHLIPRVAGKRRAVIVEPTYSDYRVAAQSAGWKSNRFSRKRAEIFCQISNVLEPN